MAKKTKRKSTTSVAKTKRPKTRKASKKLFKPKKGKDIIKGLVSVAVNTGIQKGMNSLFEGRVKESDFKKKNSMGNEYIDAEAYKAAVEKQKTLHGAANIGLWLVGAGNALPKDYVSAEYLEINALEHGVSTFLSKSKNEKMKKAATYIQGEDSDEEATAMIEAANSIEAAFEAAEADDVAMIEASSDSDEIEIEATDDDVVYVVEGIEGMNPVVPGIEEEDY